MFHLVAAEFQEWLSRQSELPTSLTRWQPTSSASYTSARLGKFLFNCWRGNSHRCCHRPSSVTPVLLMLSPGSRISIAFHPERRRQTEETSVIDTAAVLPCL
ncbi:hypothetical protein DAPPUDRAFT_300752 [Daphnia pulex]|uniref:Uncharacterized protein n=1 Tax=Daphnia pulex TaxID=6669 RepID=E9G639_DAPPU|nr:hypothetical protein DAPPUDRAFT_300752 [Daphnia pulex]|eukprot:EFX84869.1 hypothetical protein DAPPUDRAFT_300752 [Daphnia pulex]